MKPAFAFLALLLTGCPAPTVAVAGLAARPAPPPWEAPKDPLPGLRAANLQDYLQLEGGSHIHTHLDVYYDGQPVTVPGGLGMDPNRIFIAPLHTHTPTGILHLQAPPTKSYTLAQVFAAWGVPLTGALAWDNGTAVPEPATLVMQDHHEVVVAYGTLPPRVPVEYNGWLCIDWKLCE